jgi:hypothetical protein
MEDSVYRPSTRSPSTLDNHSAVEYRHNGISMSPSQQQRQQVIHGSLQIRTAPSYASTARSVSNRSTISSNRQSNTMQIGSPVTFEAERIAIATAQAKAAARSILLAGGTQSSALSTAKAAAKSVLQPNLIPGEKPPLANSQQKTFRNRRKNRQQAEIIASMALMSANEMFGQTGSPLGHDMMIPGSRSVYADVRDSEFPDDYTNLRSLGTPSAYGRSHSVRSYQDLHQAQYPSYNERPYEEKQYSHHAKPFHGNMEAPIPSNLSHMKNSGDMVVAIDPIVLKSSPSIRSTKQNNIDMSITKNPSITEFFRRKQIQSEDTFQHPPEEMLQHPPDAKKPKTKIPSEMPMPRSSSIKGNVSMKGSNDKNDVKIGGNGAQQSRQHNESQLSCYSDSTASHTNSSAHSYGGSTYDENTAEYTKDTFESVVEIHDKSSLADKSEQGTNFFSNMDPFVSTFSEVFSCTPEPRSPQKFHKEKKYMKQRPTREITEVPSHTSFHAEEQRDPPVASTGYDDANRLNLVESDSLLKGIDIHSFEEPANRKRSKKNANTTKKKKTGNNQSMELLVLKALSVISPKSAVPKRPRLNLKPFKQSTGATKDALQNETNDGGPKSTRSRNVLNAIGVPVINRSKMSNKQDTSFTLSNETKESTSNTSRKVRLAELTSSHSNQQRSGSSEDYYSLSDDSVTVKPVTSKLEDVVSSNGEKMRRFPSWFQRTKKTHESTE